MTMTIKIPESEITELMAKTGFAKEKARAYLIRRIRVESRAEADKRKQTYKRNPETGMWTSITSGKPPAECPEQVKIMQEMVNFYDQKRQGICDIVVPECMQFNPFKTHPQIIMNELVEEYDN